MRGFMRLTSFTDYGLRMLMKMASTPGQALSTAEFAEEFQLSRHHLTKIMQKLAREGIVETRRGIGGGAVLAKAPAKIRLGELIALLEEGQPLVECFDQEGNHCTLDGRCKLKKQLRHAEQVFLRDLNRTTLADIALPSPTTPRK
ncbi:putative transcriptional regulator [Hyphomonas jannaschiana VP2]|uniref:Putative transcriptional regulator n=2 Tax=Hyphomonas jannaschiana TaxID=86 RepID=A0A059FIK7_9PROT|nr:putative transcriptional regulator [Hyphomonas jannaschiana VP2]